MRDPHRAAGASVLATSLVIASFASMAHAAPPDEAPPTPPFAGAQVAAPTPAPPVDAEVAAPSPAPLVIAAPEVVRPEVAGQAPQASSAHAPSGAGAPSPALEVGGLALALPGDALTIAGIITAVVGQKDADDCVGPCDGAYATRDAGLALIGLGTAALLAGTAMLATFYGSGGDEAGVTVQVGVAQAAVGVAF